MPSKCPYCGTRDPESRDHVFPEFLGGTATIGACAVCNNSFGHSFEGRISHQLAPTMLMLSANGVSLPRGVVWKKALWSEKDQCHYDLHPDNAFRPSKVKVEQFPDGRVRVTGADATVLTEVARGFVKSRGGRPTEPEHHLRPADDIKQIQWRVRIGIDERRLAVKVMTAMLAHCGFVDVVAPALLAWLGGASGADPPRPMPMRCSVDEVIDGGSGPAHSVYVEGSDQGLIGVFRLCDLVSIYACLSPSWTNTPIAFHGRLDMVDFSESFAERKPVGLQVPASSIPRVLAGLDQAHARERMDRLIGERFGKVKRPLKPTWLELRRMMGV